MAALGLDDDEFKAIEQLQSKFAQLESSIRSLIQDTRASNPLPHPSSIQASAAILQRNLQSTLDTLNENSELFSRIAIRPSTNFPGRTQEATLTQLLRKKLEPDVEELVQQGREKARLATPEGLEELQGIWHDLRAWTHERIARYARDEAGDVYTAEERAMGIENVRTGLKRDLEEESDDEDGDEDEEDEDIDQKPQIRGPEPETLMWFAARGDFEVSSTVEYERKVDVYRGLQGVNRPPSSQTPASSGPALT